jgi:hypothetical protein
LWLLHNGDGIERLDNGGDLLGLMSYDNDGLPQLERLACAHNMFDERAPTGAVQHFRQAGFQPSAFAGCENDDG